MAVVLRRACLEERLSVETFSTRLTDEGSLNGTYVNGWRVADEIRVRPGDEVRIGESRFILVAPSI